MWLYYFLIIYILLCAALIFSLGRGKKNKIAYLVVTMGLLAFLAMFKSQKVGNDTDTYIRLFNSMLSGSDIQRYTNRYEVGFLYLNRILCNISNNYQILFIFAGAYIYFAYGRLIYKHSSMVWLSVFLFFTMRNFDLSLSGIRQMMALATVALSYEYIIKKKPLKFVLTVILAISFHTAAVVFLIAYPLSKVKLTKKLVFGILLSSIIAYATFMPLLKFGLSLFPRYSYYLNGSYLDGQARIATIAALLVDVLILIISEACNHKFILKKHTSREYMVISNKTYEDEVQSVFLLLGCAFLLISLKGTILSRFENIFALFSIIYLPNSIAKIKDIKLKTIILYTTVVLFFIYSTVIHIYRPEWQSTYPYAFFWN